MGKFKRPRPMVPPIVRLLDKVQFQPNGCWLFTGYLNKDGYGKIRVGRRGDGTAKSMYAHVVCYEELVGPVPEGLELDHVKERCTSRACCYPDHLEPVTHLENIRRGERWGVSVG